jgi:hypothetical protein
LATTNHQQKENVMADKKRKHQLDAPEMSGDEYLKQVAFLDGIWKQMVDFIATRVRKAGPLSKEDQETYSRLLKAWESLHHALDARWLSALNQSRSFIFTQVNPFTLKVARQDAIRQIGKCSRQFPKKNLTKAYLELSISLDVKVKWGERISAAKKARVEAAKVMKLAFEEEKESAKRAKTAGMVREVAEERNALERKKEMSANSRRARKAQQAIIDSLSIPTS